MNKEILSAYMDGNEVNAGFTETLCNDKELQATWARYHTVRSVLRKEEVMLGNDFSAKMTALIEAEEIERSAPTAEAEVAKPRGLALKLKRWATPIMQAGIAAGVCAVAVFGVNLMNSGDEVAQAEQPVLQTQPFSTVQPVSFSANRAVNTTTQPTLEQIAQQQSRINALLQNHELQRRVNSGEMSLEDAQKIEAEMKAKAEQPQNP